MGINEALLLFTSAVSLVLVLAAWKLNRERLYSVIVVFLILIAVVGGKIVLLFGHETNTGNIFYASAFIATYFLIERHGKREGVRSIWIGVLGLVFFSALLRLALLMVGSGSTADLDTALSSAFLPTARLAVASICGYIVSQTVNVYTYVFLKERYGTRYLWLRTNACNILAQAIDSIIFFTVAFAGVVPPANVLDILITGFIIKTVFVMLASPLLYLNRVENDSDGRTFSLTLR